MTELLAKAFAKASELPEDEQEVIAALILKEIESERRWEQLLNESQNALADLANEALAEHRAGNAKRLDPDDL
ncbi:MAG: hypothetical protein ACOC8X_12610 [Chloroflexota bacterium]